MSLSRSQANEEGGGPATHMGLFPDPRGGGFVAKQLMKRANDGDEAAAAYQSQQLDFSLPELISLFMLHRITPTVTAAAY